MHAGSILCSRIGRRAMMLDEQAMHSRLHPLHRGCRRRTPCCLSCEGGCLLHLKHRSCSPSLHSPGMRQGVSVSLREATTCRPNIALLQTRPVSLPLRLPTSAVRQPQSGSTTTPLFLDTSSILSLSLSPPLSALLNSPVLPLHLSCRLLRTDHLSLTPATSVIACE